MTKVDLITGFLGSGKTTFLIRYARYLMARGEKIGIIENDYGAVNVDVLLLTEALGDECQIEMVIGDDYDCHRRRFKTKLITLGMMGLDRVIVEPSGIYDTDEFFDVLHEEPLDRWYEVGNVLSVVDVHTGAAIGRKSGDIPMQVPEEMTEESRGDSQSGESRKEGQSGESRGEGLSEESAYLLASQIADAGMLVISRMQEASPSEAERAVSSLCALLADLGGRRSFSKDRILAKPWEDLTEGDFARAAQASYVRADHVKLGVDRENEYSSLFFMHSNMTPAELADAAGKLFANPGYGQVMRVKGFVRAEDGFSFYEINAVRQKTLIRKAREGQEIIIVIGEKLDKEKIRSVFPGAVTV